VWTAERITKEPIQKGRFFVVKNELALCHTLLSEPELTAAIAEGRAMTMEKAIHSALETPIHP
jgi:hypothetical protein